VYFLFYTNKCVPWIIIALEKNDYFENSVKMQLLILLIIFQKDSIFQNIIINFFRVTKYRLSCKYISDSKKQHTHLISWGVNSNLEYSIFLHSVCVRFNQRLLETKSVV